MIGKTELLQFITLPEFRMGPGYPEILDFWFQGVYE